MHASSESARVVHRLGRALELVARALARSSGELVADLCACMWRRGHQVPPREEAGAGVVERPFPLQRIHNFPLRGRGTPGLRQGHNAPCPPEAHRSVG